VYEMFRIKRRFQLCKVRPPRLKTSFVREHQNAWFLLLSSNLGTERLQIDTDLLGSVTGTADGLFGGTNTDDFEPRCVEYGFFSNFFRDLKLPHRFQK